METGPTGLKLLSSQSASDARFVLGLGSSARYSHDDFASAQSLKQLSNAVANKADRSELKNLEKRVNLIDDILQIKEILKIT